MRDIPVFHTAYGIASLRFKEIPYFHTAYITIQSALDEEKLLEECADFCRAVGAEKVYATGLTCARDQQIDVIKMVRDVNEIENSAAMLFPVQDETMDKWRQIYNRKMRNVTGASYLCDIMAKEILAERKGYFVHRDEELIGIGTACGDTISAVASIKKGAGKDIVTALFGGLVDNTAVIEVASDNIKAVALYESLGFVATGIIRTWYKIFDSVKLKCLTMRAI